MSMKPYIEHTIIYNDFLKHYAIVAVVAPFKVLIRKARVKLSSTPRVHEGLQRKLPPSRLQLKVTYLWADDSGAVRDTHLPGKVRP